MPLTRAARGWIGKADGGDADEASALGETNGLGSTPGAGPIHENPLGGTGGTPANGLTTEVKNPPVFLSFNLASKSAGRGLVDCDEMLADCDEMLAAEANRPNTGKPAIRNGLLSGPRFLFAGGMLPI